MFEILEHTADLGFRAAAASLPELFENAAEALVAIAMDLNSIEIRESYLLSADGDSPETLLVNWLSEVLYHFDGKRRAMRRFTVTEFTPTRITGQALGELCDPTRHSAKLIIKGVTYHQLKIQQNEVGWSCEVYLDI